MIQNSFKILPRFHIYLLYIGEVIIYKSGISIKAYLYPAMIYVDVDGLCDLYPFTHASIPVYGHVCVQHTGH